MRNLAFGRLFGLSLAVISLVGAVVFVKASFYFHSQFQQWTTARPLETMIDLSRPGSVTVPFHQTCSVSHGEYMMLECDLGEDQEATLEELLQGLSGSIVIKDQMGEEVVNQRLNIHQAYGLLNREIVLVDLPTFSAGRLSGDHFRGIGGARLSGLPTDCLCEVSLVWHGADAGCDGRNLCILCRRGLLDCRTGGDSRFLPIWSLEVSNCRSATNGSTAR